MIVLFAIVAFVALYIYLRSQQSNKEKKEEEASLVPDASMEESQLILAKEETGLLENPWQTSIQLDEFNKVEAVETNSEKMRIEAGKLDSKTAIGGTNKAKKEHRHSRHRSKNEHRRSRSKSRELMNKANKNDIDPGKNIDLDKLDGLISASKSKTSFFYVKE